MASAHALAIFSGKSF